MILHYLQHVPFEGLGYIEKWAEKQNHKITSTRLYEGETLPSLQDFDFLVIMGGPMSVHDREEYPWLTGEEDFIRSAIEVEKPVLGICLGAQLIARVLGAPVLPGKEKEIGWYPIGTDPGLPSDFPLEPANVFHWHGETFGIPARAVKIASSQVCDNQGFLYQGKVLALQFHMESTPESVTSLIENCGGELTGTGTIQQAEEMLADKARFSVLNRKMDLLLDYLF